MNDTQDAMTTADEPALHERVASLEVEIRNSRIQNEEIRQALLRLNDAVSTITSSTNVNAALLKSIQTEVGEVKKKADFIPNTLMAAVIATAVTVGITFFSQYDLVVDFAAEAQETESSLPFTKEGEDYGTGSN